MSEVTNNAPVVDVPPVKTEEKAAPADSKAASQSPVSPAADLREIQQLLLGGMFPGTVAPSVIKAFHLLDAMAKKVEEGHAAQNKA